MTCPCCGQRLEKSSGHGVCEWSCISCEFSVSGDDDIEESEVSLVAVALELML